LEKLLEDAQIKLFSVVTDLCGAASRRILTALMSGMTDPAALVLLRGGLKVSAAVLTEALTGRFTEHHAFMTRLLLNRIDQHTAAIQHLEQRIEQKINSVHAPRDLLTSIPGVSRTVADIIIAETGADMTAFPTAAHLCSWAGVSPGQHESAGRRRTAPTREPPPQSCPWHRRHVDNQTAQHRPLRQAPLRGPGAHGAVAPRIRSAQGRVVALRSRLDHRLHVRPRWFGAMEFDDATVLAALQMMAVMNNQVRRLDQIGGRP
jgi:hypothetical protein